MVRSSIPLGGRKLFKVFMDNTTNTEETVIRPVTGQTKGSIFCIDLIFSKAIYYGHWDSSGNTYAVLVKFCSGFRHHERVKVGVRCLI